MFNSDEQVKRDEFASACFHHVVPVDLLLEKLDVFGQWIAAEHHASDASVVETRENVEPELVVASGHVKQVAA